MKIKKTADEPQGVMDATLESISISGVSSDGETINGMQEIKQKLASAETTILNQNDKIKLYEASIKDKNDLIKSLNTSIELIQETKELMIKQLRDEITSIQNALDQSKNLSISPAETLQKQFDESQSQIASLSGNISQLKAKMAELISKMGEKDDEIATLKDKSTTEEDKLRATIADLEKKAKIYEAELKEKYAKIAKYTSNMESCEIDFIEGSEWPNIKLIKIGDKKVPPLIEKNSFFGGGWMVILRRFNGRQSFSTNSCSYEKGFGNVSREFWLGLESLHQLTSSRRHELYIEIEDFDHEISFGRYDNFVVGSKEESYALKSLGDYWGDYNVLKDCIGEKFVYDTSRNYYWWFSRNEMCCLTGKYRTLVNDHDLTGGMYWLRYRRKLYVKECKMMIIPK